jgi:hypothetical protein
VSSSPNAPRQCPTCQNGGLDLTFALFNALISSVDLYDSGNGHTLLGSWSFVDEVESSAAPTTTANDQTPSAPTTTTATRGSETGSVSHLATSTGPTEAALTSTAVVATTTLASSSGTNGHAHTRRLVSGLVPALIVLALIAVTVWLCLRRRARSQSAPSILAENDEPKFANPSSLPRSEPSLYASASDATGTSPAMASTSKRLLVLARRAEPQAEAHSEPPSGRDTQQLHLKRQQTVRNEDDIPEDVKDPDGALAEPEAPALSPFAGSAPLPSEDYEALREENQRLRALVQQIDMHGNQVGGETLPPYER